MIDSIYEAAFLPNIWDSVLHDMARSIGAEGTVLFNSRAASTRWRASQGIMDMIERILAEDWTSRNPRAERLLSAQHHGFLNEADQFTEEEYNRFPIYTDLMQPCGYGFGAATAIHVPSGDNLVFSVEKKRDSGPVSRQGIEFLDLLRPHLARAALLSSRLEFERINAAVEALQMTGLPSAVLTNDGKVIASNALLEGLAPQVSVAAFDHLRFAYAPANAFLTNALAQLRLSPISTATASRSFPLPQREGAPAAVVHLVPVKGDARDIFVRAASFLIITPVDRKQVPSAETIQGLFDLSPAEARVARSLAAGSDVAGTALHLSLSPETVRSHVKAILAKSGMNRQTDFVAAIATIPPIG
ncbi:LuxR family transcriptional regulator [Mesorhizobium sp. L-8-10]|nr:LuxR family transcriptional regulator [Mesorhizobium sp. L-8-10]